MSRDSRFLCPDLTHQGAHSFDLLSARVVVALRTVPPPNTLAYTFAYPCRHTLAADRRATA